MKKLKYTEGPWTIVEGHNTNCPLAIRSVSKNVNIINTRGISRYTSEEGIYNAQLIVMAPEMLEALIDCYNAMQAYACGDCGAFCHALSDCEIVKTKNIIEKATGMRIEEVVE